MATLRQFPFYCSAPSFIMIAIVTTSVSRADESFDTFRQYALPFLEMYCFDCHSGNEAEADVVLDGFTSGELLFRQQPVVERMLEMMDFGLMPPKGAPQPGVHEIASFVAHTRKALDDAERVDPANPGRVTMRRLNRVEYSNTVRDLLGVDFDPSDDFPADGIGYGYDNIGDVLTLPPLLLERYLNAAEVISQRALSRQPRVPPRQVLRSHDVQPWGYEQRTSRYRQIDSRFADDPERGGPIVGTFNVSPGTSGEYRFQTQVSAEAPDDQLVRIAILACSDKWEDRQAMDELKPQLCGTNWDDLGPLRLLKTEEVVSRDVLFPRDPVVHIPAIDGFRQIAVALYRPDAGELPVIAHVGWFTLDGPLDKSPCLFRQKLDEFSAEPPEHRTRHLLHWLLHRAWRRDPTDVELSRYERLMTDRQSQGDSWEDAVSTALQAVLVSPKFLFRIELDSPTEDTTIRPLDDIPLASRLSYFLWSSMPDDELLQLAEQNRLRDQLVPQMHRMLDDPRSSALVDNFVMQWLQLKKLDYAAPDRSLFPTFDDGLRASMLEETRRFAATIIAENRSVSEFLGSDFTFLNEDLAKHYGIADLSGRPLIDSDSVTRPLSIRGPQLRRVQFDDDRRGGLLRQAAILTATSNPTRTSPVKRGHWVLEQLLSASPPAPPPDVPDLEDANDPFTGTLRERTEQHRRDARCASCHAVMDPIGFAFEHYDAIGRHRERDNGQPIDASGTLPTGESFDGPAELIGILKTRRDEFATCLAENMLTYALGRGLEYYDRRAIREIVGRMQDDNDRFRSLVAAIVLSDPFQSFQTVPGF